MEDWKERFYDEVEEQPELPKWFGCCGNCDEFNQCTIPGHEEVGWCPYVGEHVLASDKDECHEE